MKRNFFILLIVASILIVFSTLIFASGTIDVKDYIKGKFPSVFSFYLSSLENLDLFEKEFIDLLQRLPSALDEYKILKELDIDLANQLFDFIWPK